MNTHEHDTVDKATLPPVDNDIKPPEGLTPAQEAKWEADHPHPAGTEYDTPPKEWVPGTTYDPNTPPEELTNTEWIQWAYDNLTPFWAIKKGLLQRTPPTITSLEPSTAAIGDPSFTLYVSGTNFHSESVIVFAGQDENTTLLEDGRLQTGVNMDFWHGADAIPVYVSNGVHGAVSEPVDFTFTAAAGGEARKDEGRDERDHYDPDRDDDDDDDDRDDDGKPAKKAKARKKK
jgi:hypothetical protein